MTIAVATDKLKSLANAVSDHHRGVLKAAGQALNFAKYAGDALNAIKGMLPPGEFGNFVDANCGCSQRTARVYMRVSEHWPLIESKRSEFPELSIRGAIEIISEPKLEDSSKRQHAAEVIEEPLDIPTIPDDDAEKTPFERETAIIHCHLQKMVMAAASLRAIRDDRLWEADQLSHAPFEECLTMGSILPIFDPGDQPSHASFEEWAVNRLGLTMDDIKQLLDDADNYAWHIASRPIGGAE